MILSNIKLMLKKLIPFGVRRRFKKYKRKFKNFFLFKKEKATLNDVRILLTKNFNITKGDNLIVSSSFGNLNADFSPKELIELLQDIVGNEGNIVMPFYPPGNSYEWAQSGQIFDMKSTRSSMGILTQVFSEMPDVYKSMHPTKAVVAWGKHAKEIINGHECSKTPFYWDSPYGWLLKNKSKSLGLGVLNRPIIHACEDCTFGPIMYLPQKYCLPVRQIDGKIIDIQVYVHSQKKMKSLTEINNLMDNFLLNTYKKVKIGFQFSYIFDVNELFVRFKENKLDFNEPHSHF